jgi:hypothetical protein
VQPRQRHLRGAAQVQVVVGHAVDLLLGVGQEAGAVERLLAHQHRRHDRREALLAEQPERPAHERQLEEDQLALQVGEARARHARAGLEVDQVAEQLEVVAAGGAGLADLTHDGVGVGRAGIGQVRQRGERAAELLLDRLQLAVEPLLALADLLDRGDRLRSVAALALQLADPLAGGVLLGAQALELGQNRTPALVELEHSRQPPVGAVAAPRERRPRLVGSGAERLQVEHVGLPG